MVPSHRNGSVGQSWSRYREGRVLTTHVSNVSRAYGDRRSNRDTEKEQNDE